MRPSAHVVRRPPPRLSGKLTFTEGSMAAQDARQWREPTPVQGSIADHRQAMGYGLVELKDHTPGSLTEIVP